MSVPTPTPGAQHRPARVTTNLGIPVPGDDELADYVTGWGQVADQTDARITAAVASAVSGFATAIEDARLSGSQPARTISFLTMGV